MLLLIEGADGTGKTTLTRELCETLGFEYLHFGIPNRHPLDYWFERLRDVRGPTVIDRLHLSEDVYGEVFREGSALTELDRWVLEGWLIARGCGLVMCSTSWKNLQENQAKTPGVYHGQRQTAVIAKYWQALSHTYLPSVIYDYSVPVTKKLVYRLVKELQTMEVAWDTDGIGSPRPAMWLVGERHGMGRGRLRPMHDQVVFHGPSGEYLRQALALGGLRLTDVHVSNAIQDDGETANLLGKWEQLVRPPQVIALGRAADAALVSQGIAHETVPHPQWWRRFRYRDLSGYAGLLQGAA